MTDVLATANAPKPTVPVRDPDGRALTPCSPEKAASNVADGLADLRDGVLHLRYRPLAYRRVFRRVLARDGLTCAWCGEPGSTLDHVIPVSYGGQAAVDNCVVACRACNHMRHNVLPSRFMAATGYEPTHPLILRVLAHETALVSATRRQLARRTVDTCRSKEEAQVWVDSRQPGATVPALSTEPQWSTRRRTKGTVLEPYVP